MKTLLCILACLCFVACGGDTEQAESQSAATSQPAEDVVVDEVVVASAVYPVACGCSIEGVGHCGNYIQIDDEYVAIANSEELNLGGMEWCGQSGVTAEASGVIVDGQLVAATLVVQ